MGIMEPNWWLAEGPNYRLFSIHWDWEEKQLILSPDFNDKTPSFEDEDHVWGEPIALMTADPDLAQVRAETILKLKNLI